MDLLNDVLRTLRLRGTVYFLADFRSPWGMDIKGGAFANFHLVVRGGCWLRTPASDAPRRLNEGDFIFFPHGSRHALTYAPDSEAPPSAELLATGRGGEKGRVVYGGDGPATTLICGHFEYDRTSLHPLFASLPPLIHIVSDQQDDGGWMAAAAGLAVAESASGRKGSGAVVDRLAEVLLIHALRTYAERLGATEGFLAAVSHPGLSSALRLIHSRPAHSWGLEELARETGMSRSVFAEKFKGTMGLAPMQYLTHWRMQKARELLVTEELVVAEVGEMVGYKSEWAFAKAFKRFFGMGPGALRREGRRSA